MKLFNKLILISLLMSCLSCTALKGILSPSDNLGAEQEDKSSFKSTQPKEMPTKKKAAPKQTTPRTSEVELLWAIPEVEVDSYTIEYGYSVDSLNNSIDVATQQLERMEDSEHGFLYRYVIKSLPNDQTIYVSLIAKKGTEASPPSEVVAISPKK